MSARKYKDKMMAIATNKTLPTKRLRRFAEDSDDDSSSEEARPRILETPEKPLNKRTKKEETPY
jgi:hypothetical protein